MFDLVGLHLLDDRARLAVRRRQALQMTRQVALDLALGFGQKAQIPAIAETPGSHPEGERARIPQRIEETLALAEFRDAAFGPGQVLGLLARCLLQRVTDRRGVRRPRPALVNRLGRA